MSLSLFDNLEQHEERVSVFRLDIDFSCAHRNAGSC